MKRLFSLAAFVLLLGAPAAQANGPFTGCYLGAHVGASMANNALSLDVAGTEFLKVDGLGSAGVSGGGTVGCDIQITGPLVIGAWADYTKHSAEFVVSAMGTDVLTNAVDQQWSVGGRVGLALTPATMAYALAGYTHAEFGDVKLMGASVLSVPGMDGYIVGGGIETALPMKNWYVDVRYTYSHFDKTSIVDLGGASLNMQPDIHTARVGVSYKFNWSGIEPVALK